MTLALRALNRVQQVMAKESLGMAAVTILSATSFAADCLSAATGPAHVRTPGMARCRVTAGTLRINVASHDLYSLQECGIN